MFYEYFFTILSSLFAIVPTNESVNKFRNDNDLYLAVENLKRIGRLTTAISIQRGLIDGRISPDDFIRDFIPNLLPSPLDFMDEKLVRSTLKQFVELPQNLEIKKKGAKREEEKIRMLEDVRKILKHNDMKWYEGRDFLNDMKGIEKAIDLDQFVLMAKSVVTLADCWTVLVEIVHHADPSSKRNSKIEPVKESSKTLKNAIYLKLPGDRLWTYSRIDSAEKGMKSLAEVYGIVQRITPSIMHVKQFDHERFGMIRESITAISRVSAAIEPIIPHLKTICDIIKKRAEHVRKLRKYPGFENGYNDIETLFDELLSIEQMDMRTALEPLKTLLPAFRAFDDTFKPSTIEESDILSSILHPIAEVRKMSPDLTSAFSGLDKLLVCKNGRWEKVDWHASSLEKASKLDSTLIELKSLLVEFKKFWDDPGNNKWNNAIYETVADDKTRSLRFTELLMNKEHEMVHDGTLLNNSLTVAATKFGQTIPTMAKDVKDLVKELIKISTTSNKYFDNDLPNQSICLLGLMQKDFDAIYSLLKIVDTVRDSVDNEQVVNFAMKVFEGVSNMGVPMGKLRAVVKKFHSNGTKQSEALRFLPDPDKHSRVIGKAAAGISSMWTVLKRKDKVDLIIGHFNNLRNEMKGATIEPADKENLDAMFKLEANFTTMYDELNTWEAGYEQTGDMTPSERYSYLFTAARNVSGVPGNLTRMGESLEKLAVNTKSVKSKRFLRNMKHALEDLDSAGIDFTTYHNAFAVANDSMAVLDTFFVAFRQNLTITTSTTPPPISTSTTLRATSSRTTPSKPPPKTKAEKSGMKTTSMVIVIGLGVTTAILAVVIFCIIRRSSSSAQEQEVAGVDCPYLIADELVEEIAENFYLRKRRVAEDAKISARERERLSNPAMILEKWCDEIHEALDAAQNTKVCLTALNLSNEIRDSLAIADDARIKLTGYGQRFPNDFIHASNVLLPSGLKLILSQGPIRKFDAATDELLVSTVEKFYWMLKQSGAEAIVMLCSFDELEFAYAPESEGEVLYLDDLHVECQGKTDVAGEDLVIRKLLIKFKGEKPFEVRHYQFDAWPAKCPPMYADNVIKLLKRIRLSNEPVVVHCTDGADRSGTFAGIEFCNQALSKMSSEQPKLDWTTDLAHLRSMRQKCVRCPIHVAFCQIALINYIYDGRPPSTTLFLHDAYDDFRKKVVGNGGFQMERNNNKKR